MIYNCAKELIGKTPMLRLNNIEGHFNCVASIMAKLELFNPAGSIKDRVGLYMILDAEKRGVLKEGSVIIEPTSGNTGVGLAAVATVKGYRTIIVMPDSMSVERQKLMSAYGAELVLTDGALGMKGAIDKANQLAKEIPNSFIAGQFENPANPQAHRETTGPEIYTDCRGKIDILVCGVGTGGTLTGTGEYLKAQNPDIKIVAVEPSDSPLLSKGISGPHQLQGIGANFVPKILNRDIIDEVITVTTEEAYQSARLMGKKEGVLIGISSGAALNAAVDLAKREENANKNIVVILPDGHDRYLSTGLY